MTIPLGFIGVIADDLDADFVKAARQASEMGYVGIEFGPKNKLLEDRSPEEAAAVLADVGLHVLNWHTMDYDALINGTGDFLDQIEPFHSKFVTVPHSNADSLEAIEKEAEKLNAAGARLREEGYFLCYHNHDHEMELLDGKTALDRLMELTDPKLVQLELDVAWATFGGGDPAALIRQYAWRVPLVHLKDVEGPLARLDTGKVSRKEARLTDCGFGIVNFVDILEASRDAGVAWGVVEKDRRPWHGPGMDALQRSYDHLTKIGWG